MADTPKAKAWMRAFTKLSKAELALGLERAEFITKLFNVGEFIDLCLPQKSQAAHKLFAKEAPEKDWNPADRQRAIRKMREEVGI
jgi:hypothetical protein